MGLEGAFDLRFAEGAKAFIEEVWMEEAEALEASILLAGIVDSKIRAPGRGFNVMSLSGASQRALVLEELLERCGK